MANYYGNPSTLKEINKNVSATLSPAQADFDAQVAIWNSLVQPEIDSDLNAVFSAWPAPASSDANVISTLWHMKMTERIQKSKFATNSTGQQTAFGADIATEYVTLLEDIKAGRKLVPGANRHSNPVGSAFSKRRWKISDSNQPNEPEGPADYFKGGLRGNNSDPSGTGNLSG
jgi:hypothetical protein